MESRFSAPSTDDATLVDDRDDRDFQAPPPDAQRTMVVEPAADGAAAPTAADATAPAAEPRMRKLQPRRRRRIRLKHVLPAWSVSLLVHLAIFTALAASITTTAPEAGPVDIDSALGGADRALEETPILDDPTDERSKRLEETFAMAPPDPADVAADQRPDIGSVVMTGGPAPSATPDVRPSAPRGGAEGRFLTVAGLKGRNVSSFAGVPAALGTDVSLDGPVGGDPTFDVAGVGDALNQLSREILRHLNDHKVTVVWLFDESASMRDDQKTVVENFDRVSSELSRYVPPEKKAAAALNHAIVGFGKEMDFVLERPTPDADAIRRAITRLKVDDSGEENTMRAIRETVARYSALAGKDRRLLLVLVTDESGDDGENVEQAMEALKTTKTPLYVLGRQAVFGYPFARFRYEDPVTKDVYNPVIRRGPETADVECFQWDGLYKRWDEQPSGFGSWELARLAKESGGIYFLLPSEEFMRMRQREKTYTVEVLKEYMPEYVSRAAYAQRRAASDLRQTLYALTTQTKDLSYRRDFPVEPLAQRQAALEQIPTATERIAALVGVQKRLESLKKLRDREPERRWRAHYDLMLAQTVAFQLKSFEYRALMESLAGKPRAATKRSTPERTVSFVVDHADKPLAPESQTAKKYAEARKLLNDVVAEYPDTPWADLAKSTLARGFGVVLNQWEHSPKYEERGKLVPKF